MFFEKDISMISSIKIYIKDNLSKIVIESLSDQIIYMIELYYHFEYYSSITINWLRKFP